MSFFFWIIYQIFDWIKNPLSTIKKGPPKNLNIKNLNTFVNLNFYQIKIKEMNEKDKMHLKTILQCTIVVKTQIVPMT